MLRAISLCLLGGLSMALGCTDGNSTMDEMPMADGGEPDAGPIESPDAGPMPDPDAGPGDSAAGLLFALGNEAEGNTVVMFERDDSGALTSIGQFSTGGTGTGMGLGSQAALAVDEAQQFLYVVNPGSNTVSSMRIYDDHVGLVDTVSSGGEQPTSVAVRGSNLYVLNAGGDGGVAGFAIDGEGGLTSLPGATRPLSGAGTAPAQVGITPDGEWLVVTERATNQIVTYAVDADGNLGEPVVNHSEGETPFGFEFTSEGVLVVSEAFGGAAGMSTASSYRVSAGGSLWLFSDAVPSGQSAACWVAIVGDRYAYTTNTASNNLSGYHVAGDGALTLFSGDGVVAELGEEQGPIDMAVSSDDAYLYVLNGGADTIVGFAIAGDGSLSQLGDGVAIPATAVGLAGF